MLELKKSETINENQLITYLENLGMLNKLTPGEKDTFIQISKAFGLNPFKREIYASKFGQNFSIVVGFEVYLKRAERIGLLDGWEVRSEGLVSDNTLKAVITIYRKDRTRPFVHEVFYSEYVQKTSEGHPNKFWREKPITMIKKVAMSQGFRLCFSDELGGMPYTKEELDVNTTTIESNYEIINEPEPEQPKIKVGEKAFIQLVHRIADKENVADKLKLLDLDAKQQGIIDDLLQIMNEKPSLSKDEIIKMLENENK